jgi:lysozyme
LYNSLEVLAGRFEAFTRSLKALDMEIRDSVGDPKQGAANRTDDVKIVQGLLNMQMVENGRCDHLLKVDGRMGRETLAAIVGFQRRHGLAQTGLIAPRDKAFSKLLSVGSSRTLRADHRLFDFLKRWAQLHGYLYDNDGAGNTTIGYGHLVHPHKIDGDPSEEQFKYGITEEQADEILRDDVRKAESEVNQRIHVPLTQNMFDALTSLMFNLGPGGFDKARMGPLLKEGDYLGAARDFERLDHMSGPSGGMVVSAGLANRRRAEEQLFLRC